MRVPKRYRDVWHLLEVTTATQGVGRESSGSSWRFVKTEKRRLFLPLEGSVTRTGDT